MYILVYTFIKKIFAKEEYLFCRLDVLLTFLQKDTYIYIFRYI